MLSHVPNLLTLLRIGAVPALVLLLWERDYEFALAVFVLAGLSDGLDGYVAKRFGYVTRLGSILDPIADKMLIVSAYLMLTLLGDLPLWLLVTVAFRDLLIVGGYLVLASLYGDVPMRPSAISKLNTFLQIALVVVVLVEQSEWARAPWATDGLIWAVVITTLLSGGHYVWIWAIRRERQRVDEPEQG